jgi:Arc/MetJ family transcription regulator
MKTTIDISDQVMEQALLYTAAKTKKDAVRIAVEDYNRRQRLKRLAGQLGSFDGFLSPEELKKQREMDCPI